MRSWIYHHHCSEILLENSGIAINFKLSQYSIKAVSRLSLSCHKVVSKLYQSCIKVVSRLYQSCLIVVSKLYQGWLKVVPKLQSCNSAEVHIISSVQGFFLQTLISQEASLPSTSHTSATHTRSSALVVSLTFILRTDDPCVAPQRSSKFETSKFYRRWI